MEGFVTVGHVSDFKNGRGKAVRVGRETIAVFRVQDRFFALQDACPHMGASLSEGTLLGDRVRCTWHEWTFDLATGNSDVRSWACARVFEVRVEHDRVLIRRTPKNAPQKPQDAEEDALIEWNPDRFFKKPDGGSS